MVVIGGNCDSASGNTVAKNFGLDAFVLCDVFHFGRDNAGLCGFYLG